MARFVCSGDLHLGSGPDLAETPEARLADQEAVLEQIVDAANELDAPLLWVGDAFERPRPTPAQILAFRRQIFRLKWGALLIPGNHDREGNRPTALELVARRPNAASSANLYLLDEPTVFPFGGAWICALPWTTPANLVAAAGGGDRDEIVRRIADGLLDVARGLYLEAEAQSSEAMPVVLAAHWSVSAAETASGMPTDLMREPVLDLAELEGIGFDAIVLGHIHKPQLLGPRTFYVGSPCALNFGEPGDHCAWLLDTDAGAFQIELAGPKLRTIDLQIDETLPELAGEIVKIRVAEDPEAPVDVAGLRREALAKGARKVWSVTVETERAELVRGAAIDEDVDENRALELWLEAAGEQGDATVWDLHAGYLERIRK